MTGARTGHNRRDLRGFLSLLESGGQLQRITAPVDPDLELDAIADRVLARGGPALLIENVIGSNLPLALNLLGTVERVLWSMGMERPGELEELGSRLALLRQPRPPRGLGEAARGRYRLAIDANTKIGPEKRHEWGQALGRPAELEAHMDGRRAELGLGDLKGEEPDPALFGCSFEPVLERLTTDRLVSERLAVRP